MQNRMGIRSFLVDEQAISEEFTSLPALSIVMIGFTLFIILFIQTYTTYEGRIEQLQNYQMAEGIATKLTNPDCYFIREAGLIDIPIIQNNTGPLRTLREQFEQGGIMFLLCLHWNNFSEDFPESPPNNISQRVAVSKNVGIYLNEAQTVPGTLTIIIWRNPR